MDYGSLLQGNAQSGGWRYPGNRLTSNDAITPAIKIDDEFLKKVAGNKPTGLLDQAVQARPLDQTMGLIPRDTGEQSAGQVGQVQPGHEATSQWGANQYGYDVSLNPAGAAKGMLGGGMIGGLLGGINVSSDPLGQFAYQQLLGQENRDISSGLTNYGASPTANGPPNEAQARALAEQLARELAAQESSGGYSGGYDSGYGSISAGGSPDGYW